MNIKKQIMPVLKRSSYLLFISTMMILMVACGKQTKETTKTQKPTAAGGNTMSKQELKEQAATMEADAITLARASCTARKAKKEAERRPESEFYQTKANNLIAERNRIRAEMQAKYEKDPATKEQFDAAVEKAKSGLDECKGYTPKKD